MKSIKKLGLILPILILCFSEVISSKEDSTLKKDVISLSCNVERTDYIDGDTGEYFKERNYSDSQTFRFPLEINKSKKTIQTTWMLNFIELYWTELEYSALAYNMVGSNEATSRLTVDRMSLKWRLHTFDSNIGGFAPANGEPEKQSSFQSGQCYKADKI